MKKSTRTDNPVVESYIVRIYRSANAADSTPVGTVHTSDGCGESASAFHNADELWAALAGPNAGKPKRRAKARSKQR